MAILVTIIFYIIYLSSSCLAQNLTPIQPIGSGTEALSQCRISTRDLIATAQDTATRVLQGVCNPRELSERFESLEKQVVDQFNVLKTMVLNVENEVRGQDSTSKKQQKQFRRILAAIRKQPLSTKPSEGPQLKEEYEEYYNAESAKDNFINEEDDDEVESPRTLEIGQNNSTIHQENGRRVFTYYWNVQDLNYRMKNWGWRRSLRSEGFYIFKHGYRMYLRIYPNQDGKNVNVHVGLTKGEHDADLTWPFKLKHKISILDHSPRPDDLSSRVWDPTQLCSGWNWRRPEGDNYECVGLGFPQDVLYQRDYIHNDSIVIKLTVFLD